MNYLDSLNDSQLEAVRCTEGPVRVLAGAGTGKTRALTARYCYLADLLGIDPGAILCVTFTNRAAAEMKQRIRGLLGDFDAAYICTLHSFCVRLLKEDIHVLNYPANFIVADEEDQSTLLLKVYADMGLTLRELPIRRAVDYIAEKKGSDDYVALIGELGNESLLAKACKDADQMECIYLRYLYEQKKNYMVDFDDIIVFAHHILEHCEVIREKWQQRIQYVMVDEFQDVSPRQYGIARLLAGAHRNIFIVGDPDQTIYTWRGADVKLILDFDKLYAEATTIVLAENYRSTPQILAASNSLIAHNAKRYPKELRPNCPDGPRPYLFHARSEKREAEWIAKTIAKAIADGTAPCDIAVLYRAHHQSRPIEDALIKHEVKYVIFSGTAFYARREVKDVLCYLRMLTTADDMAFDRTINNPSRNIGRKKQALIAAYALEHGLTRYEALKALADTPQLARTAAREYVSAIETCRQLVDELPLGDLTQRLLDLTGYETMLRELSEWERLDNLAELKRALEEAGHDDDSTLDTFLARAALIANADRDDSIDSVRLMTVHTAKGMEFDTVFVAGLSENAFPTRRSTGPDDIEEERRLAYVAVTRARRHLYLSDSEGYAHDKSARQPSRFIYEMGLENLELSGRLPMPVAKPKPMAGAGDEAEFAVGDTVEHPVFGRGHIVACNLQKQNYTVAFDGLPVARTLRFGAPLSRVE